MKSCSNMLIYMSSFQMKYCQFKKKRITALHHLLLLLVAFFFFFLTEDLNPPCLSSCRHWFLISLPKIKNSDLTWIDCTTHDFEKVFKVFKKRILTRGEVDQTIRLLNLTQADRVRYAPADFHNWKNWMRHEITKCWSGFKVKWRVEKNKTPITLR